MFRPAFPALLVAGALALLAPTPSSAQALPAQLGSWTPPFEEGGAEVPRCTEASDQGLVCKPTAVSAAVLRDGRVLYINGVEGIENAREPTAMSLAPQARDGRSRLLDLRSGTPEFAVPGNETGPGSNPMISSGQTSLSDPAGFAGVPGRPGDGFVGSAWGSLGLPSSEPTSPPDDEQDNDANFFCSDLVTLADGRLLDVGGTDFYNEPRLLERQRGDPADVGLLEAEGLRSARIFDPDTNSWMRGGDMKYGRWYPSVVTLADGKVLVASGVTKVIKSTQGSQVRRTETYDPETNAWTENRNGGTDSENTLPLQPRLMLMPDGRILYSGVGQMWGPSGQAVDEALYGVQQLFDPTNERWEIAGLAPLGARSGAFQVLLPLHPPYDQATLMDFGGTLGPHPGGLLATPLATLTTVHASGALANEMTGSLNVARWFPSGVLLPDGTVMAVGGADRDGVMTPGNEIAVRTPELYNPKTGQWSVLADHVRDRTYHNSALLLPDGRVLLGGHAPAPANLAGPYKDQGPPFANNDPDPSFEVYSPPYLFRGPRPRITAAPTGVAWRQRFTVGTPEADEIESVALIRTPSPQHVVDSDQRMLFLDFAPSGNGRLEAVAPPRGEVAPPGWYYLFVNRRTPTGTVPSVARMVRLGPASDPAEAVQPFPDDAAPPVGGSATEADDTSDRDPMSAPLVDRRRPSLRLGGHTNSEVD
ncbi:MAG TPA: galactose oxidase-like domain-containing protein [Acidimicrobiia bacterium]